MPQLTTRNRTSPGPGSGTGASRTVMLRTASKNAARMSRTIGRRSDAWSARHILAAQMTDVSGAPHGGILAARALRAAGVDALFALPGGHILPLFEGARVEGLRLIDTRHEENAAFMAEGWALATGRVAVAAVTAGPGFANAFPGLAEANAAGVPLVVISGRTGVAQRHR